MEQIVNGVIMIIIGLVGLGVGYIVPHINTGITALSSNAVLKNWAVYLIKYAEEFISKEGRTKMDWVVSQLSSLAKNSKVKITDEQIRVLGEGVYNEIRKEVNKIKFEGFNENYKLIFETTGLLSNNQIAKILNAIQPVEVKDHQQANNRLVLNVAYSADQNVDVDWVNSKIHGLDFCSCVEAKRGV